LRSTYRRRAKVFAIDRHTDSLIDTFAIAAFHFDYDHPYDGC
jgi:hypothetical protein